MSHSFKLLKNKIISCVFCFTIVFGTLAPRSAHAIDIILLPAGIIILLTGSTDGLFMMTRSMPTPDPISTLLTLPIFLLAEKQPASLLFNETQLLQQGYTQDEIDGMKLDIQKIRTEGAKNNLHFQNPEELRMWLKSLQLSQMFYEQLRINE